jgi:hypothetical protein
VREEAFFEIKLDASSPAMASSDIGQPGSYKATGAKRRH